jgi:hypothetical protein
MWSKIFTLPFVILVGRWGNGMLNFHALITTLEAQASSPGIGMSAFKMMFKLKGAVPSRFGGLYGGVTPSRFGQCATTL